MKRNFEIDLISKKLIRRRGSSSDSPISDLDSFEVLSLAKKVSNWKPRSYLEFSGTLDKEVKNEKKIFTDELYKKLNLESDKSRTHIYFSLAEETIKSFLRNTKKEYILSMGYSCDGNGGTYRGNLIKKLYFEVKGNQPIGNTIF